MQLSYEAEEGLWRTILEESHVNITRGEGCLASEPGSERSLVHTCDTRVPTATAHVR